MYSPDRWQTLAALFTDTHHSLYALPLAPLLHIALSSGLSALKTPLCHSSSVSSIAPNSSSSVTCPICSTELNDLARGVPYAHHTKSHVEPDLVLLPNRCVYGRQRLEEYSRKAGLPANYFKDPRMGDIFTASSIQKVYIS